MLRRVDEHFTQGTHIIFRNLGCMNGSTGYQRTTNIYEVLPKGAGLQLRLGVIKWFGRWRKYVFEPYAETVYEETCLREISQFIEEETKSQRKTAAAKRKAAKA